MKISTRLREACNSVGSLMSSSEQGRLINVVLYAQGSGVQALREFCENQSGCALYRSGIQIPFVCATLPRTLMSQWLEDPTAQAAIACADLDEVYITLNDVSTFTASEPANLKHKDHLQHPVFLPWAGKGVRIALLDSGMNKNRYTPEQNVRHFDMVDSPGESTVRHDHATMISHIWIGVHAEVPGLIPNCLVLDIRIMGSDGTASVGSILQGLDKAWEEKADIVSCSWGSRNPSDLINSAITAMERSGILVVCSAGNEGPSSGDPGSSTICWPANNPLVLAVGAVDAEGRLSSFSSTGDTDNQAKPDLVELGEGILTAGSTQDGPWGPELVKNLVQGTSFSCPRVVAVAAQLIEAERVRGGRWTPDSIKGQLQKTCCSPVLTRVSHADHGYNA